MNFVTPSGFRDVLTDEAVLREQAAQAVQANMAAKGYLPVETPTLEVMDVLQAGGRLPGTPFKLFDARGDLLAMRPDVTLQIARMCATRLAGQPGPFRFRYMQRVFREAEGQTRAEPRETTQMGVELIGQAGAAADAEVVGLLAESLKLAGVADFKIQLLPSAGDSDPNVVTRAKSGNLDYGYTKMVADVQALEGTPGITVTPIDVRYTRLFYLNKFDKKDGSPAPLADVRVRQALRYAIDMETICETLFQGSAVPANALAPDANLKGGDLNDYNYNPEKAKELLAEANWDPNTVIKAVYYYTDQATVDLMTAVQAYLADVGIKMEFELVEGDLATILWTAPADQTNGPRAVDWDICYAANAALSLHEYYDRYRTGSPTNSHTPEDAELNRLIDATNASADVNAQNEAFKELIKYENENLFTMALYYQPIFLITSDKIGDIQKGTPQFCINWGIQNWNVQ